jgi:transcriptional regulator with XRE-family HTH domain
MTGIELKVRRVAARVKAYELAEAMDVSPSRVSALEREAEITSTAAERYLAALETLQEVRNAAVAL